MIEVLDGAINWISKDAPTVRTVIVALRKLEEERTEPQIDFCRSQLERICPTAAASSARSSIQVKKVACFHDE